MAGISRSVTLVIAYLMQYYRLPMQQAYQFVKDKRPAISPNLNFMGQLVEFDRTIKEHKLTQILDISAYRPTAKQEKLSENMSHLFSLSMRMSNHVLLHAWLWTSLIPTGHRLSSAPTRPLLALRTAFISSLAASGFGSPDNIHLQQAVAQFNSQVSQHDTVTAVTVEDVLASPPHQSSLLG
ncbi:hypothetical protein EMCRGX_G023617 [Ephydatia muelleri]|eukprot:Em0017g132a